MTFRHHCALVPLADILPPRRVNRPLARELWAIGVQAMRETQEGQYVRCAICGEEVIAATVIYVMGKPVCARCAEDNQISA
jgi:hypothetical protein